MIDQQRNRKMGGRYSNSSSTRTTDHRPQGFRFVARLSLSITLRLPERLCINHGTF
jgi:hypothetical protein